MNISKANNRKTKGQASIEYLLLTGIVFLIIIVLFGYALRESTLTIRTNQAFDAVNTLALTADMVYGLGPGSQDYVKITLPGSVESISINGNEINLKLRIFGGISDIFATTKATVNGNLSITNGIHHVTVRALEDSVYIEE